MTVDSTMAAEVIASVRGVFKGVFPKDNLPKDALLFIPLSPEYYKTEMVPDAPKKVCRGRFNCTYIV